MQVLLHYCFIFSFLLICIRIGGNSVWSEVMSYEILNASYGAQLRRTEMEIEYYPASKITDYSVTVMVRIIVLCSSFLINSIT